ncbi:MAG: gamma-glutamyl-gamma-aminobutyrate hydrolase family protein [Acetatifactor sp.]|nr:gamma-glutamyl-gamma-aminobutyrate hydrolase family protein [Acetatifactor sp.]
MKIAIVGRKPDTENYVQYVKNQGHNPVVTLDLKDLANCDCLLLPGGGDITPAFFGEQNHGSRSIDTALDILQLQALDFCIKKRLPVLGICKGAQVINVGLGGTLYQDLATSAIHRYEDGDQYHDTVIEKNSWLYDLYGEHAIVNSAHHQAIRELGSGLSAVQHCPRDGCIEAIAHRELPILGVQWHPERIDHQHTTLSGEKILVYFASL